MGRHHVLRAEREPRELHQAVLLRAAASVMSPALVRTGNCRFSIPPKASTRRAGSARQTWTRPRYSLHVHPQEGTTFTPKSAINDQCARLPVTSVLSLLLGNHSALRQNWRISVLPYWPERLSPERIADGLALAVIGAVAIIAALTFRDYGLGWDDYVHAEYGGLLLNLYSSGFTDQRALSFVNLYAYGGGFDLLSTLAAKVLPFDLWETRRLIGAMIGIVGLILTWRLGRRLGGPLAGLIAVALLATCPLYYGNMYMNAKDSPFAVAMVFLTLSLVRAFEEYPKPSPITCAMLGCAAGLAIGTRVLGGLAVINGLAALTLIFAIEARRDGIREASVRVGQFAVCFVPALVLGYAVMAMVWPWSVVEPFNPLHAAEYFSHFFEKPWNEVFDGVVTPVPEMPRRYVPTLFLLKEPEIFLGLGISGAAGALVAALRRDVAPRRRAIFVLLVFAATFPIALTVLT